MHIFIHTNNKQLLGAKISKFSIERFHGNNTDIKVSIINVDDVEEFKSFIGKKYLRKGKEFTYEKNDLQSFTLSRFMPPEEVDFGERTMVIDPDIFAVQPFDELMNIDLENKNLACCKKNDNYDTSMMILESSKLQHWKMSDILKRLENKELDYQDIMSLNMEDSKNILEVPRIWNNLDKLTEDTKLLHTTGRLTQPWKTGLKIDFTRHIPKLFGFIPRVKIYEMIGRIPKTYQPHPDKNIEKFFFELTNQAYEAGAVTDEDIDREIKNKNIRSDFREKVAEYLQHQ